MFSPKKSQMEICLLKSNLEEIENELVVQRSVWPKFDAENEQKFRESLHAVRVSRALSVEIEQLNQENVRLVAKRMRLKTQSEELAKSLEKGRESCNEIETTTIKEKHEIEMLTRKYEDMLREKTMQFRKTRACFNEDEMKMEIEKVNDAILELEDKVVKRRTIMEDMMRELDGLTLDVPEDLLVIVGKNTLDEKMKAFSEKCEVLQKEKNALLKNIETSTSLAFPK